MPCEELRFPNPWLCRVAQGSSPGKCALDIAFALIGGTKIPGHVTRQALAELFPAQGEHGQQRRLPVSIRVLNALFLPERPARSARFFRKAASLILGIDRTL